MRERAAPEQLEADRVGDAMADVGLSDQTASQREPGTDGEAEIVSSTQPEIEWLGSGGPMGTSAACMMGMVRTAELLRRC